MIIGADYAPSNSKDLVKECPKMNLRLPFLHLENSCNDKDAFPFQVACPKLVIRKYLKWDYGCSQGPIVRKANGD